MFFKPGHHGPHRNKLGQHAELAHTAKVRGNPTPIGICSRRMNQAPNTPPSMPTCPAVKLMTREAENMTL